MEQIAPIYVAVTPSRKRSKVDHNLDRPSYACILRAKIIGLHHELYDGA